MMSRVRQLTFGLDQKRKKDDAAQEVYALHASLPRVAHSESRAKRMPTKKDQCIWAPLSATRRRSSCLSWSRVPATPYSPLAQHGAAPSTSVSWLRPRSGPPSASCVACNIRPSRPTSISPEEPIYDLPGPADEWMGGAAVSLCHTFPHGCFRPPTPPILPFTPEQQGGAPCTARKVGCFPLPVAMGPRVLKSAPYSSCSYTRVFFLSVMLATGRRVLNSAPPMLL